MKHIKKFNESQNLNTITMDDVRKTKHNLTPEGRQTVDDGVRRVNLDFLSNYGWNENTVLKASVIDVLDYNGKEIQISELQHNNHEEIGYAIKENGVLKYIIGIYEPHGIELFSKRGLITAYGHEEIVMLWLADGGFDTIATR